MLLPELLDQIFALPTGSGAVTTDEIGDDDGLDNPHEALAAIAEAVAGTDIHVSISASDARVDVQWRPKTPEEIDIDAGVTSRAE